jgi:Fe-S-cluster containining protein
MEIVLKQYRELLARVDAWFSGCMEQYPDQISCKTGCSGCCRGTFDITLLDAYHLKLGFDRLADPVKAEVLRKCGERLNEMREQWPELDHPYILNYRSEEDWEQLMPEEDETPCVLLGTDGRCLVYDHRPMTCRLHGIPLIDTTGEVMYDDWCTMNFADEDPMQLPGLRGEFDEMLHREVALFRDFTSEMFQKRMSELDTFIPTALLTDFENFDWKQWLAGFIPFEEGTE